MSALVIRDSAADDMTAVAAIYAAEVTERVASFEEAPPSLETLAGRREAVLGQGLPWIVAEVEARIAGYAYASPFRTRSAYRYSAESSVYVAPDFQGRGVGRALMSEMVSRCRARGLRQLMAVMTVNDGEGSRALHASLGFREVGLFPQVGFKLGRWLDVRVMQLALTDDVSAPTLPGLDPP